MPVESDAGLLAALARAPADAPAIRGDGGDLSYGELRHGLGVWARRLGDAGMEAGTPVAAVSRRRGRLLRAVWTAIHAGVPVLPLHPEQPRIGAILADCGVRQAIVDADVDLPSGIRRLPAAQLDRPDGTPAADPRPAPADAPCLLVATSGTEGRPRVVMHSAGTLAASARATSAAIPLAPGDVWLACLPLIHIGGMMIPLRAALSGACVLLRETFEAVSVVDDLRQSGVSHLSLVPSMLHRVLDTAGPGTPPARLRHVLIGGAALPHALRERATEAGWPVWKTYGMTETCSHVALAGPGQEGLTAVPGAEIDLVRGTEDAEAGWIRIGGSSVMLGYMDRGLAPGHGLDEAGRFVSRDLGRLDPGGQLQVLGRGDDMLNSGGVKIHPAQIEDLMASCPGLRSVAVTARPDPVWGQRVVALYEGDAAPGEIEGWCRDHLPGPIRPREFQRVRRLPLGPSGKILRQRLPALLDPR